MKILVAFDYPLTPPKNGDYAAQLSADDWRPIRNVSEAIARSGHEAILQGVFDDIMPLITTIRRRKPDLVFNMLETCLLYTSHSSLPRKTAVLRSKKKFA